MFVEYTVDVWPRVLRASTLTVCVSTIIVNALSVLAVSVSRGRMSANIRLICSLSLSDLLRGVCGILHLSSVTKITSCERLASKCLLITAHMTALLTLLVLAVDHYLAICRPLYHRTDANIARVNIAIVVIWILSIFCSSFEFLPPVSMSHLLTKW